MNHKANERIIDVTYWKAIIYRHFAFITSYSSEQFQLESIINYILYMRKSEPQKAK